jgi:hypothetical protein
MLGGNSLILVSSKGVAVKIVTACFVGNGVKLTIWMYMCVQMNLHAYSLSIRVGIMTFYYLSYRTIGLGYGYSSMVEFFPRMWKALGEGPTAQHEEEKEVFVCVYKTNICLCMCVYIIQKKKYQQACFHAWSVETVVYTCMRTCMWSSVCQLFFPDARREGLLLIAKFESL